MAITRTQIAKQLLAQGGRTGFQGGGKDMGSVADSKGNVGPGGGDGNRDRYKSEQYNVPTVSIDDTTNREKGIMNKKIDGSTAFLGDKRLGYQGNRFKNVSPKTLEKLKNYGNLMQKTVNPLGFLTRLPGLYGDVFSSLTPNPFGYSTTPEEDDDDTDGGEGIQDPCKGPNPPAYCFTGLRSSAATPEVEEDDEIINYRLMNKGGMADETVGGIMDLESSRQMYGLGKLVKKVTRSVKKIAKSPIGKAALLYAGGSYLSGMGAFGNLRGAGFLKSPAIGFKNFMMGKPLGFKDLGKVARGPGFLDKIGGKVGAGILGTSALSYFMTPEEEEEQKLLAKGADIDDVDTIINNPYEYTNPRLMAEGGSTEEKEPVAKKVMPLLDMEGQEKDYRETGGFVDMGRMEKADDVPARLSKNEFVFTADAVRNAGDGSVDKGAEVMYNMMKNLESGGDVSEESQGLEGARDMFKTSQRLEEVL